jgi:putative nucleotidyltransferase with HDIG domain
MQMEAPGTYHHSLVVAQLSENAANAIGANPLIARVCALFHDIGKTKKPEYFTENQRDRLNPHDENNPSLSALIIKAHVKDGVDLAVKHKLPRMVVDVIQQHHGTTLIRYFFQRALSEKRQAAAPTSPTLLRNNDSRDSFSGTAPGLEPVAPCESTYRYDGPRPQFKESAIIHLADAVEAASRSMRKISPQHLGELIDQVFHDRIEDGQLDEAPVTFEDLSKIKSSFTFTLLNMLHSRVGYAPMEEQQPKEHKAQQPTG